MRAISRPRATAHLRPVRALSVSLAALAWAFATACTGDGSDRTGSDTTPVETPTIRLSELLEQSNQSYQVSFDWRDNRVDDKIVVWREGNGWRRFDFFFGPDPSNPESGSLLIYQHQEPRIVSCLWFGGNQASLNCTIGSAGEQAFLASMITGFVDEVEEAGEETCYSVSGSDARGLLCVDQDGIPTTVTARGNDGVVTALIRQAADVSEQSDARLPIDLSGLDSPPWDVVTAVPPETLLLPEVHRD